MWRWKGGDHGYGTREGRDARAAEIRWGGSDAWGRGLHDVPNVVSYGTVSYMIIYQVSLLSRSMRISELLQQHY